MSARYEVREREPRPAAFEPRRLLGLLPPQRRGWRRPWVLYRLGFAKDVSIGYYETEEDARAAMPS